MFWLGVGRQHKDNEMALLLQYNFKLLLLLPATFCFAMINVRAFVCIG